MRTRLAETRVARLATVTSSGGPHLVPCCFALDGDVVFSAVDDAKPKSTMALRRLDHVRANPAVSLLVDHYDDSDWSALWWIRVDGRAEVVEDGPACELGRSLLAAKYPQYAAAPPPGAVVVVDIDTWRAWP
jgi:PPOX class probable F420-dependent enzyme